MDVWISLDATIIANNESETLSLQTSGQLDFASDGFRLQYEEVIEESLPPLETTLRVCGTVLTLERRGTYASALLLEPGVRHLCEYATPYGTFTLGVHTHALTHTLTEQGGEIRVLYTLDMPTGDATRHEMTIAVRPDNITSEGKA